MLAVLFALLFHPRAPVPLDRWISLFNGRIISEWRGFRSTAFPGHIWAIQDGALFRRKTESDVRRDLITTRSFGDFELEFEWKISPGGNSGIKYLVREDRPRSWELVSYRYSSRDLIRRGLTNSEEFRKLTPRKSFFSPIGFEFQIIDDLRNPDAKNGLKRVTGALYDILPRKARVEAPSDKYNKGRIVVHGNTVQHWVNGIKTLDYNRSGPRLRAAIDTSKFARMPGFGQNRRGHITLQDHGDKVWFRRIRIRELR